MSFTVFLGNLPAWVTADDIQSWLNAEALVADSIKVIRNPETQESKGFAFIEAPNAEEMQAIIRRFDRAPLEDKLLRANPAQPPKGKSGLKPGEDRRSPGGDRDRRPGGGMGRPAGDSRPPMNGEQRNSMTSASPNAAPSGQATGAPAANRDRGGDRGGDRAGDRGGKRRTGKPGGTSAFAEELAKAL
jgi:RNA recognition motif-containing protein